MGKNKGAAAEPQGQAKQDKKGKQKQERQPQQRFERKEGGLTHYSSFLQVLPMDIEHTSPAVLLFFDKERYLFNAGEGIQRLFREHRLKIRQVNAYFITRVSTETMSGLAGMALSVTPGDAAGLLGKQVSANIKGPRGLAGYVAAFRTYVNKENTVAVEEFDSNTTEPLLKSDVVSITPFLGSPAKGSRAERGHSPAAKRRRVAPDNSPEMSDAEEDAKAAAEGRERPADLSPPATAVYLVRLSGRPGKFLPDKARQLGVKPGPLFGELQRGHSVTLEDGRVVTGADVCEPPVPGPAVMVVDTPDAASLAAVAAHPRLLSAAAEATAETDGAGRLCLVGQAPVLPLPESGVVEGALSALRVNLVPPARQGLEYGDVFRRVYGNVSRVCADICVSAGAANRHASIVARAFWRDDVDPRQAELTFLGTASSQPSKFRNVSGCYVDLFERGGLLVSHMHADHHGGLYRLLEWRARRGCPPLLVVGPQRLFEVLVKYSSVVPIQFTFVPNLALSNASADRQLPPAVQRVLESTLARLGLAGTAPAAGDDGAAGGKAKEQQEQQEGEGQGWRRLPPRGFRPFYVHHIHDAHGLRLEGEAGWSIVFSGDTRPCNETIAAARGATLLVHEATFEESMVGEAKAKKHSTTAEAVSVGERAGAYRIILTHFSTRYPTLPELDLAPHPRNAGKDCARLDVAGCGWVVNLADLPWQPALVRPLGLLFKQLEAEKLKDDDDDE
eukprot:XP_001689674.1 RNase Z-like protein [Chlamydomonas reinhardtii]